MNEQMITSPIVLDESENFGCTKMPRLQMRTPRVRKAITPNSPCGCGCGSVPNKQGSRYMPGHDGRHKGRLLAQVKAGNQDARTELISLGWGHFLGDTNG